MTHVPKECLAATWLDPVCEVATAPTGNEIGNNGWRVLINGVGTGAFTGHDHEIAVWNDNIGFWSFEAAPNGAATVDKSTGIIYLYDGSTWTIPGASPITVDEVVLSFPDTVPADTAINIQTGVYGGGGPATVFGDAITLPATGAAFKGSGNIQVYLNGQNLFKGDSIGDESANWVSSTQIALDVVIRKFSIIKVVSI